MRLRENPRLDFAENEGADKGSEEVGGEVTGIVPRAKGIPGLVPLIE